MQAKKEVNQWKKNEKLIKVKEKRILLKKG